MSKNILGIFDGGDIEEISALIDKLEKSSFDYLKLEGEGLSIVIGKNGAGDFPDVGAAPAVVVKTYPASTPEAPDHAVPAPAGSAEKPIIPEQDGVAVIKSPTYGLFYAQPEPGSPPYVKLGSMVKVGDTVGLMEIMKTFNAITSPVDGEVVAIHVKNEELLNPGQPLVSIRKL